MIPHEQYPGLFDEFCKFYCEQSLKHGEHDSWRTDAKLKSAFRYWMFVRSSTYIVFYTDQEDDNTVRVPFPPYLLALREMSLI